MPDQRDAVDVLGRLLHRDERRDLGRFAEEDRPEIDLRGERVVVQDDRRLGARGDLPDVREHLAGRERVAGRDAQHAPVGADLLDVPGVDHGVPGW